MIARLWEIAHKPRRLALGLMSGTSADGIDVALVEFEGDSRPSWTLHAFHTYPYTKAQREAILDVAQSDRIERELVARLDFRVAELFAEAALRTLQEAGVRAMEVDFIGSHGQTIAHFPEQAEVLGLPVRATWQIGDPAVIAKRTGIITVGDFRPDDIALGGSGAPLVPLFDWLVFQKPDRNVATLNIGGISNITVIPAGAGAEEVLAFDTGPGNALLDSLAELCFGEPFDRDGAKAAAGRVDEVWVARLLEDPYFAAKPPKSTGRERFGRGFAERFRDEGRRRGLRDEDILATAAAFVACSIAHSLLRVVPREAQPSVLYCSGGGSKNPAIMARLRTELPKVELCLSDEAGIDADAKEAVAFALLADRTLRGEFGNCPGATGARRAGLLGKICLP